MTGLNGKQLEDALKAFDVAAQLLANGGGIPFGKVPTTDKNEPAPA
jgi:hypothetical protein